MKRSYYLVELISTATEQNPNFAGETTTWLYGKGQTPLKRTGNHYPTENFDRMHLINEYGYTRIGDAKRSYIYTNTESGKFWSHSVRIVEVVR